MSKVGKFLLVERGKLKEMFMRALHEYQRRVGTR